MLHPHTESLSDAKLKAMKLVWTDAENQRNPAVIQKREDIMRYCSKSESTAAKENIAEEIHMPEEHPLFKPLLLAD